MPTIILHCTCRNEWQDRRYGKGRRVHNTTPKSTKRPEGARCTSCETWREARQAAQDYADEQAMRESGVA